MIVHQDMPTTTLANLGGSNMEYLTPFHMFILRLAQFIVCWASIVWLLIDKEGLYIDVDVRGKVKKVHLVQFSRFTPFTVWCWTLLSIYYALAVYASYCVAYGLESSFNPAYIKITHLFFEISFAMAFLVTFIVTFILLPQAYNKGMRTDTFFYFLPLLFHNANVTFMTIEILTNKISIELEHFPFVICYGLAYILFSWLWFQYKGVFYYFFLDYEREYAILFYLGLVTCCTAFFFLGHGISYLRNTKSPFVYIGITVFTYCITRVKDIYGRKLKKSSD
jgi:hypothetical protein